VLAGLEAAVRRDDRRFGDGLHTGRPVPPREYRQPSTPAVLVILAACQTAMLIVRLDLVVVAVGAAALVYNRRAPLTRAAPTVRGH
jgi:hypothetical protein